MLSSGVFLKKTPHGNMMETPRELENRRKIAQDLRGVIGSRNEEIAALTPIEPIYGVSGNSVVLAGRVQGCRCFHATDEYLSAGTRGLGSRRLEGVDSGIYHPRETAKRQIAPDICADVIWSRH